ncbi:peptidylprolyl isomerase family protein FPR2 NDAI_0F04490 [Naumovozyma dairenensis CBS 421]|uniref:peptidylprolyl isomerase n=1 Tax=Naumovozyma dairenensis (strain ATCC 10597 / BCRC 20456 / CBS 421 / NBRC 0211 / NRRL Y-12639) TaxID=1071378 RepID=G0WDA6_NAUDC|nr:hypothetical protein NDAI_0F04490 [Naumovozyma dairenensis CBS 421]CCD25767.1 hypothetical protein NDAI_0F04490 [Naumovozyma dairenensis CBS 421]
MRCFTWLSAMALFSATTLAGSLTGLDIKVTHQIPISKCPTKALAGDLVDVHYVGKLRDTEAKFDSSYDRGTPITFKLGSGQVIEGWDKGLVGMCIGEKRTIQIPSSMAYGARGIPGVIPENADLVFDVQLVNIK